MTLTHHMKVNPVLPGPARFIMSRIPGFEMLGFRAIMVEKTVANSIMPHIKLKENTSSCYFFLVCAMFN